MLKKLLVIFFALISVLLLGCSSEEKTNESAAELGTEKNPIKMALVPATDTQKLVQTGEVLADLLHKETGLYFKIDVPTSYTAVVTAIGAKTVDVGWLSPLPYVIAHDKYGAEVILTTVRDNASSYKSGIIVRADSGIKKIEDLKGKKFAYVDPASTSGSLYAKDLLRSKGFDPVTFFSETIYAGGHDKVVTAVYNKQVDGGAIYMGMVEGKDAREKMIGQIPDVMEKVIIIEETESIPNDTVTVRKDLPEELVEKIRDGLMRVAETDEGKLSMTDMYGITGFVIAKDSDYDSVRRIAKNENITLEQLEKK
ncbi:MAG: phosphate/phosphite/phosphonate ABC transporter substrate-binding protein [Armatimonadota bacterium]